MNANLCSERSLGDWVDAFEKQLFAGSVSSITEHLPSNEHPEFEEITAEIFRVSLEYFWDRGQRNYFSDLRKAFPSLAQLPAIIGPVAFEDYRLRLSCGLPASLSSYQTLGIDTCNWQNWLHDAELPSQTALSRGGSSTHFGSSSLQVGDCEYESTLNGGHFLADESRPKTSDDSCNLHANSTRLPGVGERLGDFLLVEQLGTGAFSRVFIARQLSLASRSIVLKVAYMPLGESERLARLQHGNIVPLYFAEAVGGFYLLGMPLLGVVTLKDLIDEVHDTKQKSGDSIVRIIQDRLERIRFLVPELADQFSPQTNRPTDHKLPIDDLSGKAWETAVLTIVSKLADGLEYAHRRGLQHRDIKPANILIGFDGQPMLLDFNLSRDRTTNSREWSVGGTLPYMPPEQIDRSAHNQEIPQDLGVQGDIYSLGVVLYEALTGYRPHDFSECPSGDFKIASEIKRLEIARPRSLCTSLTPAAEAIALRCLEYVPAERYKDASQLGEDIRRHLTCFPLRHCQNPSTRERITKWIRRNQSHFSVGTLIAFAIVSMTVAAMMYVAFDHRERWNQAQQKFFEFKQSAIQAEAALFFADGGSREPGRAKAMKALRIINHDGDKLARTSLMSLLSADQRLELESKAEYLTTLLNVETSVTSSTFATSQSQDRIVLATQAYFSGGFSEAITLLDAEIDEHPQRFVLWFLKGRCHFAVNEYQQAKQCFIMASAIEPHSATCWVARGTCEHQLGRYEDAIENYDRAIDREPDNFAAYYNRALAYEKLQAFNETLVSLSAAELLAPNSTRIRMARRRAALAAGNAELAESELKELLKLAPATPEDWILRGLAKLPQDPGGALRDFEQAKNWKTTQTIAYQNSAHVLSEIMHQPEQAIDELTKLLKERPGYPPALGGRAVLSARLGRVSEALKDVELCEQQKLTPQMHYQVACVYALLAGKQESLKLKAMHHLAIATSPAYGAQQIASDSDLNNLHGDSDFRAILDGIDASKRVIKSP